MVCGLDVFHEQECEMSVMGFVASYNRTITKYWTATQVIEKAGSELCPGVGTAMTDAMSHFKEVNESYPEQVILYRDAPIDCRMNALKEQEVKLIEQSI